MRSEEKYINPFTDFERLFSEAEIAKLKPEDINAYEGILKVYRDNKNTMDYAIATAKEEAKREGATEREMEIAKEMKKEGLSVERIARITGLTKEQIEKL